MGKGKVRIPREPLECAAGEHDLIVVGGGIYGVALAYEAAGRGYRTLLLERADFGGGTSWSSLRIVHGGLRYLQTMDLRRFRQSVVERRWFLRHFPDLVRPLPCLMPLYGRGLNRPSVLRLALAANDLLSLDRNHQVEPRARLNRGRVLSVPETERLFPKVDRRGLKGGAQWWDGVMLSSERVVMDLLGWACAAGARALNYVDVERIVVEDGRVVGVEAQDVVARQRHRFRASCVINATGPRGRLLATQTDRDVPGLFQPTLAFNLLIDRPPPAEVAVAVQGRPDGPTYFVLPWKRRILAGTWHSALPEGVLEPAVGDHQVERAVADLNAAIPGCGVAPADVIHVYAGLLPGRRPGSPDLATRAVIHDHGAEGGPHRLYSVSGVKFTTARRVAEDTLRAVFGRDLRHRLPAVARPVPLVDLSGHTLLDGARDDPPNARRAAQLRRIEREEAVLSADDALLRRMDSSVALAERRYAAASARSDGRHAGAAHAERAGST